VLMSTLCVCLSPVCCVLCVSRPEWDQTVTWLQGMGADVVTTEQKLKADLGETDGPALECVNPCWH